MRVSNELSGAETGKSMDFRFKTGIKTLALEKPLQRDRRSVTWHMLYPASMVPVSGRNER